MAPSRSVLVLNGKKLTPFDLVWFSRKGKVAFSPECLLQMEKSHQDLLTATQSGVKIYGVNTGYGPLDQENPEDVTQFQKEIIRSHATGTGSQTEFFLVRGMILARLNALAHAQSGISIPVVEFLLKLLEKKLTPFVPREGSVGSSDLAPLAHIALLFLGKGKVYCDGKWLPAAEILQQQSIEIPPLVGRDGLALINDLSQSKSYAAFSVEGMRQILHFSEIACAFHILATNSKADFLRPEVLKSKPHEGLRVTAERILNLLGDSVTKAERWRDPLSIRYCAHILGAARTSLEHLEDRVQRELNSNNDNPIIFSSQAVMSNSGNSCGQEISAAMYLLAGSLVSIATASESHVRQLLLPSTSSRLPKFLIPEGQSRASADYLALQYTAVSVLSELKAKLSYFHSQSDPSGFEDYNSMSAHFARNTHAMVKLTQKIIGIELMASLHAFQLSGNLLPKELESFYSGSIQTLTLKKDKVLGDQIEDVARWLNRGGPSSIHPLE